MGFGQVAIGLASVVLGIHHLNNAARQLGRPRSRSLEDALIGGSDRPFHDSGRVPLRMPNGQTVPARMRSFRIRSLEDRINHLRKRVDADKRDPRIYAFVRSATSKKCGDRWCINEKDNLSEARAIFNEIRKSVRYTSDIAGVDTYQNPTRTLALRSGDCDDYSTLTCAALLSAGIPCRFKVIRTKGANDWNHIYAQAGFPRQSPSKWVSMDASVPKPFGWEAPATMVADSRVFPVR